MNLLISALTKMLFGISLIGAMLFLPAWTFNYFGAWLFIGVLFVPMVLTGIVLFLKAPDLLKKRLDFKEKEKTQSSVIALSGLMFLAGFIIAGLDFRYHWTVVPPWLSITASAVFLVGYAMYGEVLRENAYLSRTVEVEENLKVVDTGLYSVIRHPMYLATVFMFLALPLVLGSWWSFCVFLLHPVFMVVRIQNEEKVLEKQLEGYKDYKKKVKYKLVPYIW